MKNNSLRKYYFEKKLKQNKKFCSDKKVERLSVKQISKSDLKKSAIHLQKSSNKENFNFNGQLNLNIKKKLFSEDIENVNLNQDTYQKKESKDIKENKKEKSNINYENFGYLRNNYYNKNNIKSNRYKNLKLRFSMPIDIESNYNTNDKINIKKEKCYKVNYKNTGITFDCEIDDLINSTTSKIENEKEEKNEENLEFKKYLEKVKKTKLSKNNLTKGTLAIIQMQISNAKEAQLSNKYISYININNYNNDRNNICYRLGRNNMCVCGHGFSRHYLLICNEEFKSNCKKCECKGFKYIPIFPEETSEYNKAYLIDFEYDEWKARCKCGHNWTKHNFINDEKCEECNCEGFKSNFCCGVCGNSWENHMTLFQTKEQREKNGQNVGIDYDPFTQEQLENILNN